MAYGYVKPSSVHTPATGQTAPATWGTAVNNALSWIAPSMAIVRRAAVQSVGDSTDNLISFDTEDIDDEGYFSSDNPTIISLPRPGCYLFDVEATFEADSDGIRLAQLLRNGAVDASVYFPSVDGVVQTNVRFPFMTAQRDTTDEYTLNVWHNAGNALDVVARVGITLLQERST